MCASWDELLAIEDIDVVDIVLPNHLHEAAALAALRSGRHVLLEKPLATTADACKRIVKQAAESGRHLLVGHELRFSPMYGRIHDLIQSGAVGQVRYMLVDLWRRPFRPGASGWRSDPARAGNWILEEPVHYFDLAAWYLQASGNPSSIFACGNQAEPDGDNSSAAMNDHFTATVRWPDGAYAVLSQSLSAVEHHLEIKVFGSKGMLRAQWDAEMDRSERPRYSLEIAKAGRIEQLPLESPPGELFELRKQIEAFANTIRTGTPLPITPHEASFAVELCLAAQKSVTTGRPVDLHPPAFAS